MAIIADLMVRIGADISGLMQGLAKAQGAVSGSVQTFGHAATQAGKALTAGLTLPIVGIGVAAAKAATDFDKEMRNIQSISKGSNAEIAALGKTFQQMSQDMTQTTDSATGLAQGFYDIQSSGFQGADALSILSVSSKAASAGLTDTQVAAKAIVSVLNAYGRSASDATAVSDVLFKTVDIGVVTFEELASQIGDVTATASIAKVPIEDVGAAIATMTKAGISPAEAVTALNQTLLAFIDPAKDAKTAAKDLGIDMSAAALASKGLGGVMAEVAEKTKGNPELMAKLFGNVRALKGALSLTRDEMKPFIADLQTLGGAAGATGQAFKIQTQSFDAAMKNFQNTMQVLMIELGTAFLPVLTDLMKAIIPLIRGFSDLPEPAKKFIIVAAGIAAALGPVLLIVGQVISIVGTLGAIFGGIIPAILAVVAVAAILYAAWETNFLGIRDLVQSFFNFLTGKGTWDQVVTAWNASFGQLSELWTRFTGWLTTTWERFSSWAMGAFDKIAAKLKEIFQPKTTASVFADMMSGAGSLADQVAASTQEMAIFEAAAGQMLQVWTQTVAALKAQNLIAQADFLLMWSLISESTTAIVALMAEEVTLSISTMVAAVLASLAMMLADGVATVQMMSEQVLAILQTVVTGAYEAGVAMATAFGNGIRSKLEQVRAETEAMVAAIRALLPGSDAERGPLSDLTAAGRALPETLAKGIRSATPYALGQTQRMASGMRGDIEPAATTNNSQPITITINNPHQEASSLSVMRSLKNLSALGVLLPAGG